MITFEQMLGASELDAIKNLNTTAFTQDDILNLILQRSEIIRDQPRPGAAVSNWSEGKPERLQEISERMGDELVRRAAAIIYLEYQQIKESIARFSPKRVADIGCGYAIFDLFVWKDTGADLVLIDLEHTEERHFGYREAGSAYSDLSVARAFLIDNGVPAARIACLNPEKDDLEGGDPIDLAFSFISCGFHYPVQTYFPFFRDRIAPNGGVILDFRARKAREGMQELSVLGRVSQLAKSANGNGRRILLDKSPPEKAP